MHKYKNENVSLFIAERCHYLFELVNCTIEYWIR